MRNYEKVAITTVKSLIESSEWHMTTLRAVRELSLPDWYIGAGFVRNAVWDDLHGRSAFTPLNDVDVVYFGKKDTSKQLDVEMEHELLVRLPDRNWSVCNQARMHIRNDDHPYTSSEDAIGHWLETPTSVGVRMKPDGAISLVAPHGLGDLLSLDVRPTPSGYVKPEAYLRRIESKDWLATWPQLTIHMPQ